MSLPEAYLAKDQMRNLAQEFENKQPLEIISWAIETFDRQVVFACSFGAEDIVVLDMLMQVNPNAQVFYLDTGKHFPETYDTRDRLAHKYGIEFIQVKPSLSLEQQAQRYGDKLWEVNPDLCCQIRKVNPLRSILGKYEAWITGIRREQSFTRRNAKKVEWDTKFKMVKVNPIAAWLSDDVWNYIKEKKIPYNPLHDQHYPSIGCSVCTHPVREGEDPRSGRWNGHQKTECGLHK